MPMGSREAPASREPGMTKKWVVGLLGVLAIAALVGVGYSAFTASATVNGTATAGTVSIIVTSPDQGSCAFPSGGPAPGAFTFSENPAQTVLNIGVSNLVPGGVCTTQATIINTGTVPVVLSNQLNESSGICAPGPTLNCYDAFDSAGLTSVSPILNVNGITTLAPGGSYIDTISVYIPAGSISAPPSGNFAIYFTGSAGI
jgi:hypothetical protein